MPPSCIFMNELILIGSMQLWDIALFSFNNERKQMLVCNRQKMENQASLNIYMYSNCWITRGKGKIMLLCENCGQTLRRIPSFLVYISAHLLAVMFMLYQMGYLKEIRNISVAAGVLERLRRCFMTF